MKPNLFIVGAPKCGTTAWVEYLRSHPDIFFAKVKEPHHFSYDFPRWCKFPEREEYLALFKDSEDAPVVAEASVRYLYSKVAAREIHDFNPESKILIFLRDQEDYLPSQHNQLLYGRMESIEDFEQAWRLSGKRGAENIPSSCLEPSFLDYAAAGRFREQVERYFALFPAEQIRLFTFRDWIANPRATYLEILRFLSVKDDGRTDFPKVNVAKHHKSKFLAVLTHPPVWLRQISSIVKRLTGKSHFQFGARILQINRGLGYQTTVDPALKQEIRRYYEAENLLLLPRIWSSDAHSDSRRGN